MDAISASEAAIAVDPIHAMIVPYTRDVLQGHQLGSGQEVIVWTYRTAIQEASLK